MAESVRLGTGRCPVCGSLKARFTLSSKQLAVVTCNACNFQGFARSEHSDEKLRSLITLVAPPGLAADPPAAPVEPVAPPAPAPAPESSTRRSFMQW